MNRSRFDGAPPPPFPPESTYQVLRPQKHGPLDLTILADSIRGIVTHFVRSDETGEGSSQACFQYEPGGCLYHDDKLEWSGWIQVYDHRQHKPAVLHLAPKEADALVRCLGIDLRWAGARVLITPVNHQGRRITVVRHNEEAPKLSTAPFDMTHTICVVFGIPYIPRQSPPEPPADEIPYPPPPKGGRP